MNDERVYRNPDLEKWCGIAVETPKLHGNIGTLFRSAVCLNIVQLLITVGEKYKRDMHSDTCDSFKCVPTLNYPTFRDLLDNKPLSCDIIGVELDERSIALEDYVHPSRAIYLFGNETEGLSKEARKSCRQLIKLPAPRGFSMNLASSGAMVLWDRYLKVHAK